MFSVKSIGRSFLLFWAMALVISSCSKDDKDDIDPNVKDDKDSIVEDQKLKQTEIKAILEADDYSSSLDTVISDIYMNDGSSNKSSNEDCHVAEYTDTGFTIVFNNCLVNGTENVNGTLTAVYSNDSNGAAFTTTFEDFYYGTIKLNGTRSFTFNTNAEEGTISFSVVSNMGVELEDGSEVSEQGTKTFRLIFGDSLENTIYELYGTWTVHDNGNTYEVVGSLLEGNLACGYITNGLMNIEKNGLVFTVDFGEGTCDDKATIEYPNGETEEFTLNN